MATRVSREFRDISLSFTKHPVTNDIVALKNEDAIKRSVVNLIRTQLGERFFEPIIGTSLEGSLFELSHPEIRISLEGEIKILLENYEPRISTNSVRVDPSPDDSLPRAPLGRLRMDRSLRSAEVGRSRGCHTDLPRSPTCRPVGVSLACWW